MSDEYDCLKTFKLRLKGEPKKSKKSKKERSEIKKEKTADGGSSKDERTEDADDHGGWWKVDKYEQIKDDVAIEFLPGCYAKALTNGSIVLGHPHPPGEGPEEEEIFTAVCAGTNQIAFKSGFGRYLGVDSRKRIMGLSEAISEPETFLPVFEDKNMALCAYTELFLSPDQDVQDNRPIVAKADKAGPHEMLRIRVNLDPLKFASEQQSKGVKPETLGKIYDAEQSYMKKYRREGEKHSLDEDKKKLKKARVDGQLYEALLDKRTKQKSDKYCK